MTLEELEQRTGRTFTIADWRRVKTNAPLTLTELEFALVEHFEGEPRARELREAQKQAQLKFVQARIPPVVVTKSAPMITEQEAEVMAAAVVEAIQRSQAALKAQFKAELDAHNRDLEARVLELEAARATWPKVDV